MANLNQSKVVFTEKNLQIENSQQNNKQTKTFSYFDLIKFKSLR